MKDYKKMWESLKKFVCRNKDKAEEELFLLDPYDCGVHEAYQRVKEEMKFLENAEQEASNEGL